MPDKPTDQLRKWRDKRLTYWTPIRDSVNELESFLDGDRYEADHGRYAKDRRLNQIRGMEIQDTSRHIAAKATEKARSVEARPLDQIDDPDQAETAVALIEWELQDFDDLYEEAIVSARELRLGVVWTDWLPPGTPGAGPFGSLIDRRIDPRRCLWDEGYHPHHALCSGFLEEKRIDAEEANETYGVDWIKPDRESFSRDGSYRPGVPIMRGGMEYEECRDDDKATLWLWWKKNDTTRNQPKEKGYDALKPDERYMACQACGWRSDTQGEAKAAGQPTEYPEFMAGCPKCGGLLERIDAKRVDQSTLAYSRGRRLLISAPHSQSPEDRALYDGAWPIPTCRTFPGLFITSYIKPGRQVGPCDTDWMWDQQIALDNLRTQAVQQVYGHSSYWVMDKQGFTDYRGRRYEFREDQFNIIFRNKTMAPNDIQHLNGTGVDPAFGQVYGVINSALTQYRGMNDLGPIEQRGNDKSGVALQTENAIGEVPVHHFKRRLQRQLGKFYGVRWDMIRATYTPKRLARLRLEGVDINMGLHGDELPNFDFIISDTPDFTGLEKDKADAFQQLMNFALNPMTQPYLGIFAEAMNFPRSIVRKVEKVLEEQRAQMEQQAMMGAGQPGGTPGEGGPMGGPVPSNNGSMNAGMVPASMG